jgi:hypothetical protein
MDVMGSDALQSEDAMRQMWGDSTKAVQCQHARITYGDFLLLMKGQTTETPPIETTVQPRPTPPIDLENSLSSLAKPGARLLAVAEVESSLDLESMDSGEPVVTGELLGMNGLSLMKGDAAQPSLNDLNLTPVRNRTVSPLQLKSAPTTPADHKRMKHVEFIESPLSMDDDDDITSSGPGVAGSAASLTPPMSPARGVQDYITPMGGRRSQVELAGGKVDSLMLPGLLPCPEPYSRRRSRSMDEREADEKEDAKDLHTVADAVRDLILPDAHHTQKALDDAVKDKSQSALVVNRKLYRAHRQMRLAVLEASKRFEEQQAAHAREVILAQRETEEEEEKGVGMIQAGLVMRHGQTKQVSSEAIRAVLMENQVQQQALVEKANRRGGRGRRSRKKTISDMSGMLSSMGQDELSLVASKALEPPMLEESKSCEPSIAAAAMNPTMGLDSVPELPDLSHDGQLRKPTVPGEFRKTSDPFSKQGKYGAAYLK